MHIKSKLTQFFFKSTIIILALIVGFFIATSTALAVAPTSGLVGYWNLDGNASDVSGNGNNGTVNGDGSWATGKINQALSSSSSSYVSVPRVSALNPGSSLWSVSAWVKGTSGGSIVWKGSSLADLYELAVNEGKATFTINTGGTYSNVTVISNASVNDGNWHLITGIRSSTKTADIYVDGVFSGTATYVSSGISIDTTTPLTIGSKNGSASFFSGFIDDVRIYNRALSSSEVLDIYNAVGSESANSPTGDTNVPSVSLSAPLPGTTVSGSIVISAIASDNVGVAGVQFKLDGSNLSVEDTSTSYSISWDTTAVADGTYTLTALARDTSGNTASSSGVTIMVANNNSNIGCTYPAQLFDLTNWKETLPTGSSGSPTEITQPALATYTNDPYFMVNSGCNGVQFRAPVNGVTTSGSSNPRSELREMANNGITNASWATNSGVHTMFIDQAITSVPKKKKHIVAGQVHDSSDDVIVIRLEYPKLFIDINGSPGPTLDANYALGKRFTVKFVATNGKISIYYNGNVAPSYTLNKSGSGHYFKAGAYTQSNCSKETSCASSNYGEVIIYNVWVQHQSIASAPDTTQPTISILTPVNGTMASGTSVVLTALASDNMGIAGVQFKLDGENLGSELTTFSYSKIWNTVSVSNGSHTLTAVARDGAGNTKTSAATVITVSNVVAGTPTAPTPTPTPPTPPTPTAPTPTLPTPVIPTPLLTGGGSSGGGSGSGSGGGGGGGGGGSSGGGGGGWISTFTPNVPQVSSPPTATSTSHVFSAYLYPGITDPDVKYLQIFLISQGVLVLENTTNYYGPLTTEAIKTFQKLHGISQTGTVGPLTRAAINKEGVVINKGAGEIKSLTKNPLTKNLIFGTTDSQVITLQEFLVAKGYLHTPPTGYYGPLTKTAVQEFQRANNIAQVGIVGPLTRATINKQLK